MANRYDSGLDDLNDITYGGPTTKSTAYDPRPFTPRSHNPLITPSQGADASWAGGEGWSKKEFYGENPNTGKFSFPFGGFGGGGGGARFAEEDFERQKELDRLVWERSTPDVTGVGGQVRWDRDKNMVTSTLSPEMQAIYDEFYRRQGVFGDQATSLAGGGWEDAQKKRFEQMRSVYTDIDELAAQKQREREFATGATETQKYWNKRASSDVIDQRELGMLNRAFLESQGLIDSNLARQFNDIRMMTGVGDIANSMIKMPQPYPAGNLPGMSEASTAWADLLAGEDIKKTKGRSDMWNSILGGGSSLFT